MFDAAPSHPAPDARPTDPSPADVRAAARALAEDRIATLTRLTAIAMEIAEAAGRRAVAGLEVETPLTGGDQRDPTLAFSRAARAVRMSVALQARLSTELVDLDKAQDKARTEDLHARRIRVHGLVERAMAAEFEGVGGIGRLSQKIRERLRDEDDLGAFLALPFDEAVAAICAELGIAPIPTAYPRGGGDPGLKGAGTMETKAWVPASARMSGVKGDAGMGGRKSPPATQTGRAAGSG